MTKLKTILFLLLAFPALVLGQTQHDRLQVTQIVNRTGPTITGATPSVSTSNVFVTGNNSATNVTNFINGTPWLIINVICGDTNTTFQNNPNIVMQGGNNFTCTQGAGLEFVMDSGSIWHQVGGTGAGGGATPQPPNGALQMTNGSALASSSIVDNGNVNISEPTTINNTLVVNGNITTPSSITLNNTVIAGSGSGGATIPANIGTVAELNLAQTWTANQTLSHTTQLRFLSTNGTNYTGFVGGASTSNLVWLFPTTDSTGTQCLSSNGSLQLAWSNCSAGTGTPGGANTQVQINNTGTFGASTNLTFVSPALSIGSAAGATGQLKFVGTTSGTVTVQSADAAGTWTFKLPTSGGSNGQPLTTDGTGITSWATLGYVGGGTGGTSFTANQLVSSGASALSSLAGTTTGTNPILKLQPSSASNTALTLDTAASPTADILDININTVKTSFFDSSAFLHTPQTTYTGSGPLTLSGNEGTCPAPATGQDIVCLGDSAAHVGKISNNGVTFKALADWINDNPAAHGVAIVGAVFPQISFVSPGTTGLPLVAQGISADPIYAILGASGGGTGVGTLTAHGVLLGEGTSAIAASAAGTAGQPFTSGGASADGAYAALNLAGGSSIVTGVLPVGNGGIGASSLAGANIVTVSGAFTPGNCVKSSATTVAIDAGAPCGSGGSVALSGITNATGANTLTNGANPQTWNWALTGSTTAFKFSETSAATGTNNILLQITTLSASTAIPFQADNNGNGVKLSSTGLLTKVGTGAIDSSALNASVCPGNGCPTLDTILTPLNSVTFQFPATDQLAITGTQPASAGTGVNAGTLFSVTTPTGGNGSTTTGGNGGSVVYNIGNGGTATSGIGGNGGDFIVNNGTGGTSTSGIRARAGSISVNCGADGSGGVGFGTGQGEAGCIQASVTANQGSSSFPFGLGVAGGSSIIARNTASTSGNTVNNWSPPLGMSAHMQLGGTATVTNGSPNVAQASGAFFGMTLPGRTITLGGVNYTVSSLTNNFNLVLTTNYAASTGTVNFIEDAVVTGGIVLYPGFPTSSNMSLQNTANPEITFLLQIPSLQAGTNPYYHLALMQGGPTITTDNGGGSVGHVMWIWDPGGQVVIGTDPGGNRATSPVIFSTNVVSSGPVDIGKAFRGSGGCGPTCGAGTADYAAGEGTGGAANGSWVYMQMMTNGSGATINNGAPVKMSSTANQVTPTGTSDTVGVIGVNVGSCGSGAVCSIAYIGRLLGVMTVGTASSCSSVGMAVIVDTTTAQDVKCVPQSSAVFNTVIGTSESIQNSAGSHIDVSIRIH